MVENEAKNVSTVIIDTIFVVNKIAYERNKSFFSSFLCLIKENPMGIPLGETKENQPLLSFVKILCLR
ncbi:MAG: hypothetical protein U5N56_05875 [Candidatus Marinimicrobia bacterium]|nr:hypothetical protein [Candidatus Neomarinimicrobiota bacterium]